MSDPLVLDLFVEDHAHKAFLEPLVKRMVREETTIDPKVNVRTARGGHGRAIEEFKSYQKLLLHGALAARPDLLVVCIDGNCSTFAKKRNEIHQALLPGLTTPVVAACPDPHVERWYLADVQAFHHAVGYQPVLGKKKCARDHYKKVLVEAIREASHLPTLGGIEFGYELVERISWYRAGRADRSLKAFVDDFRSALRNLGT